MAMTLIEKDSAIAKALCSFEKLLYLSVGFTLVAMAILAIVQTIGDMTRMPIGTMDPTQLATVLNDVLFTIIILELFTTVISHALTGGFQLKAFLIVGIISSVRRILVYGAQLSTSVHQTSAEFYHGIIELCVDTGVVLFLSVALFINRLNTNKK